MAAMDVGTAQAILKEYYTNQRVTALTYKESPLYAMIAKKKDFFGESYPLPNRVTAPQGRSNDFTSAQAQKTASTYNAFLLSRAKDYSLASITSEAIMASEVDAGAFLRLATGEIDGALESLRRSVNWAIYGDGSGQIGQIASLSGATITLSRVDDIVHFELGQLLNAWSATSGGTQRLWAVTNAVSVIAVDRDLGTVTCSENVTGGSATLAANDYLFVKGDRGSKLKGLAAWVPDSAPTSGDSFFGVDRSVDVTRLAGSRQGALTKPIEEALIDMARRLGREGGAPDMCMLGFSKYAVLEKSLQSRVRYVDVEVAGIAFRGIEISGPKGAIKVFADQDCPSERGYMVKKDGLALYSLKEPIMILDIDGNQMLREGSADAYEVRCASFSQLGCTETKSNGVIKFDV